jgi:DNA-binding IclR family transcriptional regulator
MNRLDELPRCEECGATLPSTDYFVRLCRDCRPKPSKERPPSRRQESLERLRVMRAQGFSDRQIAAATGSTVASVKDRLRQARKRGIATQRGAR